MRKIRSLIFAALLAVGNAAFGADGYSFEAGHSNSSTANANLYRLGVQWDWNRRLLELGDWHVGGFWDLSLGYWSNNSPYQTNGYAVSGLGDIGLTPTFRLQLNTSSGMTPYGEVAIGFHFLSKTYLGEQRQFGTSFQFGDHIGAGVRFGDKGQYDIGYRYQHLSNGDLKAPNQGINYNILRLQYRY